jgi:hypothetical protein
MVEILLFDTKANMIDDEIQKTDTFDLYHQFNSK